MKRRIIRLVELAFLLRLFHYMIGVYSNAMYALEQYNIMPLLLFVCITDISASLFSQKSLSSSYLSEPKTRVFYISCGMLFAISAVYFMELWYITGTLGEDTSILFWRALLPTNAILIASMLLVLTLIYRNNSDKSKKQFVPMIAGLIVSLPWWYVIYQKCMDGSILFTHNTLDLLKYFFYIGTAIMIVFVTVVATIYISLKSFQKQTA